MNPLTTLADFLPRGRLVEAHQPWPRVILVTDAWTALVRHLQVAPWTLLGLWSDGEAVHVALHDPGAGANPAGTLAVASLTAVGGRYPALGRIRPAAQRLERCLRDLHGLTPEDLPDSRPWLDHGCWPLHHPLRNTEAVAPPPLPAAYHFLPVEGDNLHRIPVGPVHAGIIEPGHFRFTCLGETVVRLEQRLGYVHKGIDRLMAGAPLERAARLAGRVSGDSTVGYALAFSRAVEAATHTRVPARAHHLRALMAELERVANHLGDVGAVCNDAAFAILHAHCAMLREQVLRAAGTCFGHRLMMDRVVPGGTACDLDGAGIQALKSLVATLRPRFAHITDVYDDTPSLQNRTVGTGVVDAALAAGFGAGGFVGRASGRAFDARRSPGYPPYDQLQFEVPVLTEGDVNARVMIRIREIGQSLGLIEQLLETLPEGPVRMPVSPGDLDELAEGMALVEGFRGDILAWVRITTDGTIGRCHLRDPSWFQWPLLEAAIEGNIVADFPLCNKSFNCSYSGHDL